MPQGRKSSGQGAHCQMSVTVHITSDMSTRFNHMLNNIILITFEPEPFMFVFYYVTDIHFKENTSSKHFL